MKQRTQALQSKEWIVSALLLLLQEKPMSAITVTDITRKAGVARLTFYRHFESKEAVIAYDAEQKFAGFLTSLENDSNIDLRSALRQCFEFMQADQQTIQLLKQNNLLDVTGKMFSQYLNRILKLDQLFHEPFDHFQEQFIQGGLQSVMVSWISNQHGKTATDMADTILKIINTL